jgi:hypothetical protein
MVGQIMNINLAGVINVGIMSDNDLAIAAPTQLVMPVTPAFEALDTARVLDFIEIKPKRRRLPITGKWFANRITRSRNFLSTYLGQGSIRTTCS